MIAMPHLAVLSLLTFLALPTAAGPAESRALTLELPWLADLSSVDHGSGGVTRLRLPLSPGVDAVALLQEVEVFAPGEKKVQHGDEAGRVLWEEPLEVYAYQGHLEGIPGSWVAITFDRFGFIGTAQAGRALVNYLPARDGGAQAANEVPMVALVDVLPASLAAPAGGASDDDGPPTRNSPDPCPTLPPTSLLPGTFPPRSVSMRSLKLLAIGEVPSPALSCEEAADTRLFLLHTAAQIAKVKPYADHTFTSAHSDYATRITNAYNLQKSMWRNEVNLELGVLSVFAPSADYSSSSDCDTHLADFAGGHAATSDVDAYQLFTGVILSTCAGTGFSNDAGHLAPTRDSIVQAVDSGSGYDPDVSHHLGIVSAHEIAHNWGEPDHPQNKKSGTYNLMASGVPNYLIRGFWLTTQSEGRILQATAGAF